jgi:hypothetical protein
VYILWISSGLPVRDITLIKSYSDFLFSAH